MDPLKKTQPHFNAQNVLPKLTLKKQKEMMVWAGGLTLTYFKLLISIKMESVILIWFIFFGSMGIVFTFLLYYKIIAASVPHYFLSYLYNMFPIHDPGKRFLCIY